MKKRLFLVVVAILCIAAMCVSLIGCSTSATDGTGTTDDAKKSSFSTGSSEAYEGETKVISAYSTVSFEIVASESLLASEVASGISITNTKTNAKVNTFSVYAIGEEGSTTYKLTSPNGGYTVGGWYSVALTDSRLSFAAYDGVTTLALHILESDVIAVTTDNVVAVDSVYLSHIDTDSKVFLYNYSLAGALLEVDQIALVEEDDGSYSAYKITSVKDQKNGYLQCTYTIPSYDEVYDQLQASDNTTLSAAVADNVTFANTEAIEDELLSLASASFGVGSANFTIGAELVDDAVSLSIAMTLPDIIPTTDEDVNLDLVLTFSVLSSIDVDTEISLGSLIAAKDQGLQVNATFDNTLKFRVDIEDSESIAQSEALDAVLEAVANMIKGASEDDIEITVFNWVVPIGNGIADVNFDVSLVMNFTFSGEIGVESTSNVTFDAIATYDPNAEDQFDAQVSSPTYELTSVSADIEANAEIIVGIRAEVKFELLAGVLSVGVGATVGNYNAIYGEIATSNLLDEDINIAYGYYFEGGLYYRVDLLYGIASVKTGSLKLKEDRIKGYDAGSVQLVTAISTEDVTVSTTATELELEGTYNNIVTGSNGLTGVIESSKIKLVDGKGFVTIEDGKIALTEDGVAQATSDTGLVNVKISISVDGNTYYINITAIETVDVTAGAIIKTAVDVEDATLLTVAYTDGTSVEFTYSDGYVQIDAENANAGVMVIYYDGVAVKMLNVA